MPAAVRLVCRGCRDHEMTDGYARYISLKPPQIWWQLHTACSSWHLACNWLHIYALIIALCDAWSLNIKLAELMQPSCTGLHTWTEDDSFSQWRQNTSSWMYSYSIENVDSSSSTPFSEFLVNWNQFLSDVLVVLWSRICGISAKWHYFGMCFAFLWFCDLKKQFYINYHKSNGSVVSILILDKFRIQWKFCIFCVKITKKANQHRRAISLHLFSLLNWITLPQ